MREQVSDQFRRIVKISILPILVAIAFTIYAGTDGNSLRAIFSTDSVVSAEASIAGQTKINADYQQKGWNVNTDMIDWRAYVLDEYFRAIGSPLVGMGEQFIKRCKQYNASGCVAIVAIAGAETDYCKYKPSQAIYNCWGFGGSGPNRMKFDSFADAIDLITFRLANRYPDEFLRNPKISEDFYCGRDLECAHWGNNVHGHISAINQFSRSLGFPNIP